MEPSPDSTRHTEKKSTLIEFPGVSRNSMPEWRKELSERVREVQEKRAREAAREAAEAERQRLEAAIDPPQLELLPPAPPMPAMNPLVAAALKRIERAHQSASTESRQPRNTLATAVAYAPEREENDMSDTVPSTPELAFEEPEILEAEPEVTVEKAHHLSVVPVSEPVALPIETPKAPPKRLIKDDDPALNYLDSISGNLCVDDQNKRSASAFRRLVGAVLDLIFCGILTAPIVGALYLTGNNLQDPRAIGVLAGSLVVVTFIYLTLMTALTGRTWAMRLLSLRVIDTKTGLIPTGGQSIGRSFFYLMSLATVFGILFGLVSREGYTIHDRFTRTAVITT
ncbi:MAG TPA: RDD family protein [Pyrinomonadaceae bacterium]|nr:RDD family protein [Pyrinomonadaceae bacterium]